MPVKSVSVVLCLGVRRMRHQIGRWLARKCIQRNGFGELIFCILFLNIRVFLCFSGKNKQNDLGGADFTWFSRNHNQRFHFQTPFCWCGLRQASQMEQLRGFILSLFVGNDFALL